MIRKKTNLLKNGKSDIFVYSEDASELFSFNSGQITFQLSLSIDIEYGKTDFKNVNKYNSDKMLFCVNPVGLYITNPGIYTAFTPMGIIFTMWTSYGKFSIFDTISNIRKETSFLIDFCWDSTGKKIGAESTMAIFVNGINTASGNFLINNNDSINVPVSIIDNIYNDFNTEYTIQDVAIYSEISPEKYLSVKDITNTRYSLNEILLLGKDNSIMYIDGLNNGKTLFNDIYCFENSQYACDFDDITGNFYFCTFYNNDEKKSQISKFDVFKSDITYKIKEVGRPTSLNVVQKESINFPKHIYYDGSECDSILCTTEDKILRLNTKMEVVNSVGNVYLPLVVKSLNDKSFVVCDTGNDMVKYYNYNMEEVWHIVIQQPTLMSVSKSGSIYVFSSFDNKIYKILNGSVVKQMQLNNKVTSIDVDQNTENILVGYSDGYLSKYNSNLTLIQSRRISNNISCLKTRRGYNQDCYFIYDNVMNMFISGKVSNLGVNVFSKKLDDNFHFCGTIASTAYNKNVDAELTCYFESSYNVGQSHVNHIDVKSYKVIAQEVDLSGGKDIDGYLKNNYLTIKKDPTDSHGNILKTNEIKKMDKNN